MGDEASNGRGGGGGGRHGGGGGGVVLVLESSGKEKGRESCKTRSFLLLCSTGCGSGAPGRRE